MLRPPEQTRREVVEILDNVPGLTARRLARLLGHHHSSLAYWRRHYRDSNPPRLEAPKGNVHLQGALLVINAGLEPAVTIRLALGLVRLARLEQTLERLPGATTEMGDAPIREEIVHIRAALEEADQAAPAIAWTRDHLDRLEAGLDRATEPSDPQLSPAQLGLGREDELALFGTAGLVAPPASLSVGELLLDADATARDLLFAPEGHQAAAMVRSWVPLVSAAASVLDVLPEPTGAAEEHRDSAETVQFAQDLLHRAGSLEESAADRAWPADGAGDFRLDQITSNLQVAARMIREHASEGPAEAIAAGSAGPAAIADLNAARAAAIHALHMATHAVGLALQDHVQETSSRTSGSTSIVRGSGWKKRTDGLERFLEPELPGYQRAIAGMHSEVSPEDRLPAALAAWRAHVDRVLAERPSPASVALIARVQGMTAAPMGILAAAGVLSDEIVADRVVQACAESGPAWSNLSDRWLELAETHTVDRALSQAALELRTACRAVTHTPSGQAAADELATLPGVETAAQALLAAAGHGPEIASRILEAADDPDLRGPARLMLRRTDEEAEQFGLTSYDRVTLTDLGHGLVAPTPLVRQALARTTHTTIRRAETLSDAAQIRAGIDTPAGSRSKSPVAIRQAGDLHDAITRDLAATDLANVDDVAAELAQAEVVSADLGELLEAAKTWGAGLSDRWSSSPWRTTKLDAAIAAIAEATAGLGDVEALSGALQQLEAAVAEARRLGEIIDDAGAYGTFPDPS